MSARPKLDHTYADFTNAQGETVELRESYPTLRGNHPRAALWVGDEEGAHCAWLTPTEARRLAVALQRFADGSGR